MDRPVLAVALQDYERAVEDFRNSLKPKLRDKLFGQRQAPNSATDAIALGTTLEQQLSQALDDRHVARAHPRFKKRVESIQKFAPVIEVFVSSNPLVAALVWGSFKLVLKSVTEFLEPFERIFDTFRDIISHLPRVEIFQKLFSTNQSVKSALERFQIDIVVFFAAAFRFMKDHGMRAIFKSLLGLSHDNFDNISKLLAADADALDRLVSAVGLQASSEDRARNNRRNFFQWLNPDQGNEGRFNHARSLTHPGTCSWIEKAELFTEWSGKLSQSFLESDSDDPHPILEVRGEEGRGKTVLSANFVNVIKRTISNRQIAFAYYSFDSSQRTQFDNRLITATLLAQILASHVAVIGDDVMKPFFDSCNTVASEDECYTTLGAVVQHFDSIVVLVDAAYSFYSTNLYFIVQKILEGKAKRLNCINTSRIPNQDRTKPGILVKALFLLPTDRHSSWWVNDRTQVLALDNLNFVANDVASFIRGEADKVARTHYDAKDEKCDQLAKRITRKLLHDQVPNFLLASGIAEFLVQQTNVKGVEDALESLPPNVRAIYRKALLRIQEFEDSRMQLGLKVLQCVAYAFRPLRLKELEEALIVEPYKGCLDEKKRYSNFEQSIRSICGIFISITDGTVYVSHGSVVVFLYEQSSFVNDETEVNPVHATDSTQRTMRATGFSEAAKRSLTTACLAYLSLDCFSGDEHLPGDEKQRWTEKFPFFDYAVHCWLNHLFDLANFLKNPKKSYRPELGFDAATLMLVAKFLASRNSWTYLEGLVLFSSVRDAQETISCHMWPIRELKDFVRRGGPPIGDESADAEVLEKWMTKAILKLNGFKDMTNQEALAGIEEDRKSNRLM